jgi:hypothetical protein
MSIGSNFQNSISHAVNFFLTHLIDSEIPHNLIFADKGRTIFIVPRRFASDSLPINTCWNDIAGLITCKDPLYYEEVKSEHTLDNLSLNNEGMEDVGGIGAGSDELWKMDLLTLFKEKVSLTEELFKDISEKMISNFEKLYILEKH